MTREEYEHKMKCSIALSESMLIAISYISSLEQRIAELEAEKQQTIPFLTMVENERLRERIAELELQLSDAKSYFDGVHTELEEPKTCETCKYDNYANSICDLKRHIPSYYLDGFHCNRYEPKDKE